MYIYIKLKVNVPSIETAAGLGIVPPASGTAEDSVSFLSRRLLSRRHVTVGRPAELFGGGEGTEHREWRDEQKSCQVRCLGQEF